MQMLLVCGGSVQCLAWSKDSRYMYVDDMMVYVSLGIQVLELKSSKGATEKLEDFLGRNF